ncbi:hypothetical protein LNQ49_00055 [Flavobacterium sp. F-65]|uniref:Uncharacterized protein n=1 Tax=Flavobacterium pisciphilum TaxID=2893755 RepID=A0ABS8MMJ5_9FLAO|nr:hypothetical protein [Flavobacterium sp. F-65]MCC9069995.1 hypothetical protein [Flavobacterium sp. F-65]
MKYSYALILFVVFYSTILGQTTIGSPKAPHPSAILELDSSTKGVLLPIVTLQSSKDMTTIRAPANGLLVYNSGLHPDFQHKGYMSWDGIEWRLLVDTSSIKATLSINSIIDTSLSPNAYDANKPYNGILEVRYIGGNGGSYPRGTPYTHKGLTFELQPGKLGATGILVYKVTGKPLVSFPSKITNVPIIFQETTLATKDIGGSQVIESSQYTLYSNVIANFGVNGGNGVEKGYGGSLMKWGKKGQQKEIILPETGSYSFSFRLYGTAILAPPSNTALPVYIAAFKQKGATPVIKPSNVININPMTDNLLDIAEMTIIKAVGYNQITYSINLTISGKAGDKIYFTISSVNVDPTYSFKWALKNGDGDDAVANRSSMIFWKL